ncbi:2,5-diketo-D-gluconic acid reductase A [Verticillium alfalfae VaMs.102]|uniref:2,5-diketo-D-gluconic acid reductase A n=1 Tax=Verticillium alfalfae (strain VaMs.102 / ATCC MYA-4576 / FGSC 10136) TaxID=526221 RepID=C9SUK0_VERA1|nr:2,5-diketo-D-gluconic acid reductase A [Verticillium alfalfae VaMs.102]EEY22511.1 2,5-diketo-D-gluconic acid reductase A [Verticillium alfalfae VaMs.102]
MMPQLGFGVYLSPPEVCTRSCLKALDIGYRHIDTAQYYGNEREVGRAVQQSGIPRSLLFLTTKILTAGPSFDESYRKCVESISNLDPNEGYVDLFLIHSPNCGESQRQTLWQVLERLHTEGKAKSIGVSNFGIQHIEGLKKTAKIWPPQVNQIEVNLLCLHPWLQQKEIVSYCNDHGITVQAYCPLARGQRFDDVTLQRVAEKHDVAPGQILIKYSLQKGWVPLPKSDNPARIEANFTVQFTLDNDDMVGLDGLDQGRAGALVQAVDN